MDPRFFLPCFHGPRASRLGHKRKEKTRIHNLPYGPRTRLIRGMYCTVLYCTVLYCNVSRSTVYLQFTLLCPAPLLLSATLLSRYILRFPPDVARGEVSRRHRAALPEHESHHGPEILC